MSNSLANEIVISMGAAQTWSERSERTFFLIRTEFWPIQPCPNSRKYSIYIHFLKLTSLTIIK